MYEAKITAVKITVEFITGTTQNNQEQAEATSQRILLELLKKYDVATVDGTGIFSVKVIKVESEAP